MRRNISGYSNTPQRNKSLRCNQSRLTVWQVRSHHLSRSQRLNSTASCDRLGVELPSNKLPLGQTAQITNFFTTAGSELTKDVLTVVISYTDDQKRLPLLEFRSRTGKRDDYPMYSYRYTYSCVPEATGMGSHTPAKAERYLCQFHTNVKRTRKCAARGDTGATCKHNFLSFDLLPRTDHH